MSEKGLHGANEDFKPGLLRLRKLDSEPPTEETVLVMCASIEAVGMSESKAALLAGVKLSVLRRWKAEREDFLLRLRRARAEFTLRHRRKIAEGEKDWRAHVWLLENSAAEDAEENVAQPGAESENARLILSEADVEVLQRRRRETLEANQA